MNEKTVKLIEQLANKLGTTTEYLWSILIKQAPVSALIDLIYLILIILMGFGLYKLHSYFSKKDDNGINKYYKYEENIGVPILLAFIIWSILFVAAFFSIGNIVNGFFNPEYWALKEILSQLG